MRSCHHCPHLGKGQPEAQRGEVSKVIQVAELRPKPGLQDAKPCLGSCPPNRADLTEAKRGSPPREGEGERMEGMETKLDAPQEASEGGLRRRLENGDWNSLHIGRDEAHRSFRRFPLII